MISQSRRSFFVRLPSAILELLVFAPAIVLGLLIACAPKGNVPNPPASDPLGQAAKSADDIATSVKIIVAAETNLETQKLITPQEGLKIIEGASAIQAADVGYVADLGKVRAGQATIPQVLAPAAQRLGQAISNLNTNGVLGIKNDKSKAIFQTTMGTIQLALATIQALSQ